LRKGGEAAEVMYYKVCTYKYYVPIVHMYVFGIWSERREKKSEEKGRKGPSREFPLHVRLGMSG
jgi:hypothetical protein